MKQLSDLPETIMGIYSPACGHVNAQVL